ncbi:FxLYD domain-containing protein [Halocella sp. SP3-1]|uniref:FxLYD domain-containing protein n=1 Tax=Halocella sp. SP3-1 TaxID=2382161 RepID=UPI000F75D341|nr:FxLYD domain-containing protein [Halocella sp. SP3-1]AZO96130.1 hypothetical protein D7D81_16880 [Halocella sp. SP3-1]
MKKILLILLALVVFSISANAGQVTIKNSNGDNIYIFDKLVFKEFWGSSTKIMGEITNNTENNYKSIYFQITVYDDKDNIIDMTHICIQNLNSGMTKSFLGYINDTPPSQYSKYKIEYYDSF